MADSGLDIGTLTGTIELKDNSPATVDLLTQKITILEGKFDELSGRVDAAGKRSESAFKKSEEALSAFGDRLERAGERIAEYFAIRELVRFGGELLENASKLDDLSRQTGINTDELQILGAATKEYGLDADMMGRAIFQVGQRIAGGDASVVTALHMMGLSIDDVKNKKGTELFVTIERALGSLQGTMRDTAAADLFGARMGKALEAFSTDVDGAIDRARNWSTIIDAEAVKSADHLNDEIERLETSFKSLATTMIGPLAEGANTIIDTSHNIGLWSTLWRNSIDTVTATLTSSSLHTHLLTSAIDENNKKLEENARQTKGTSEARKELTAEESAALFMSKLNIDATKDLTEWQKKDLDVMREQGALNAKNAAAIGVTTSQFDVYKKTVEETAEAQKKFEKSWESLNSLGGSWRETLAGVDSTIIDSVKYYATLGASVQDLAQAFPSLTKAQAEAAVEGKKFAEAEAKAGEKLSGLWEAYYQKKWELDATDEEKIVLKAEHDYEVLVKQLQDAGVEDVAYYQQAWALRQKDVDMNTDALRKKQAAAKAAQDSTIASVGSEITVVETLAMAWSRVADGVDRAKVQVKLLDGQMVSLAEAQRRFEQGSSFTYDLSSKEGLDQYRKMNPAAEISWSDSQIMEYIKKGGTLQSLISTGVINPYAHMSRFDGGGMGDFGTGTPVMLHGKEIITPVDKVPQMLGANFPTGVGADGTPQNNFQITIHNPVFTDPQSMQKQVRQFGDASIEYMRRQGWRPGPVKR